MTDPSLLPWAVSAASSFALGGFWYSPLLFLKPWMQANAASGSLEAPGAKHPARVFGISFLFSLLASFGFGLLVGEHPGIGHGLHVGLVAGLRLVDTSFGINYQFSNRSIALWLIDAGYHLCQFLVFGLVYGLLG